ncbi:MAG TPA: hypothetical protein VMH28_29780 [Candidatus Acidoferrales bacterium]|nr:hypothetical protein [Candidatus Acidoferrales bacterium]
MPRKSERSYPTVLIAAADAEMRRLLAGSFRGDECLVLEADSRDGAFEIVRVHSRPIHVLLLDFQIAGPDWAAGLKRYRSDMQVLIVTEELSPAAALQRARELLRLPKRRAAGA